MGITISSSVNYLSYIILSKLSKGPMLAKVRYLTPCSGDTP